MNQLLRFAVVGASAALVHFLTVAALVETLAMAPLAANVLGFLVAFTVSYSGQHHWTFAGSGVGWRQGLPRYFLVACASFLLNELLFAALLRLAGWPYRPALACTLVLVAGVTFVLSRFWAFRASGQGAR